MHFSTARLALLAVSAALCVANVYYAQPLLDLIAADLALDRAAAGGIVTATQLGSVLALLFVVPLGDRLDRRRLLLAQLAALALALVGVWAAQTTVPLLGAMLLTGLLGTAMTQGLIAGVAAAADEGERGRVVGAVQGGVVFGLLAARVVAGTIADLGGWRAVYAVSAGLTVAIGVLLWRALPPLPAPARPLPYRELTGSMLTLLRTDRVLRERGIIALLMFAVFNIFWSALALELAGPPRAMPHTAIGAFGLVGLAGALGAMRAGRLADRGHGERVTGAALLLLCVAWVPLAFTPASLLALSAGIVALDLAVQALHVVNQSVVLRGGAAPGRMVGCYMLFYAAGSGAGALAATAAHAAGGWPLACLLGAGVSIAALLFWWVRVPVRAAGRAAR
ncbi:MFS transporter [Pseudoduganella umbonata]|uniref:MFS transporter n=1 Tax=Pseudoduganella umbonata TaxID=864828 RepID=A0A4P8HW93_9BURK|nr:MFS transporter [Pseudoduganella umbonata]MBB3221801.1 putative MFS family arabinose efflux permease [Pseudoduganella umbonata]QCP14389.1 MFS transporter [Pseudoduganella umbonata]